MEQLTAQEMKILGFASQDLRNKEIAQKLNIAEKTVKCHRQNIYQKMGNKSRAGVRKLLRWFSKIQKGF